MDITYIDIMLILIGSIATFFQGFYIRRRYSKMILISSFIMIISSVLDIILNGGSATIFEKMSSVNISDLPSFAYVILWWVAGYIIGGFQFIKDKDKDKDKVVTKYDNIR